MDLTKGLNDSQKKAVLQTDGPLLIVAGAGAGKTKTVVHRIGHMISKGVNPENILAVTFTNKAAKEMKERAISLLEENSNTQKGRVPFVSTFHALGVFLLRKFGAYDSKIKNFTILDDSDTNSLIKESMKYFGIDPKMHEPRAIKSTISRSVNALLTSDDLSKSSNPKHRIAGQIWGKYKELKIKQKSLDFDDLLFETFKLLNKDKEALNWCNENWKYIHVDEYQDTNEIQYRIAKSLAGDNKNICVVGDSDQSIYSWRGANIKNILEFEKDYPDAVVVLLEENYRSTKNVIAVANEVINKNTFRTPKNLFTNNQEGELISLYGGYDENDEADFVVERCIEQMDKGVNPSDIAVLFRTNFQSRILEEAFIRHGIPYQMLGTRFFERKEVKDILSYIKASLNPDNILDIKRVINTPTRGIGKVTIEKIFSAPDVYTAINTDQYLSGKALVTTKKFFSILERIKEFSLLNSVSETIRYTITESGMLNSLKDDGVDGQERLENLEELVSLSIKYDHLETQEGLEKLIEDATLMSDQDNLEKAHGVKLMTIHASKGLEFKVVFVVGLEYGLFPYEKNGEKLTGSDAEEERRLMYVALTRAREKLYLSYASIRTIFGMRDVRLPSEFISDIPDEFIERESRSGESGFTTVYL